MCVCVHARAVCSTSAIELAVTFLHHRVSGCNYGNQNVSGETCTQRLSEDWKTGDMRAERRWLRLGSLFKYLIKLSVLVFFCIRSPD